MHTIQVKSVFSITPLSPSTLSNSLFACSEYKGHLEPQTNHKDKRSKFTHRVKILYAPSIVTDHPSIGYFSVKAEGGLGSTSVKCIGWPKGTTVSLHLLVVHNYLKSYCKRRRTDEVIATSSSRNILVPL